MSTPQHRTFVVAAFILGTLIAGALARGQTTQFITAGSTINILPAAGNYTVSCSAARIVVFAAASGGASPTITLPSVQSCPDGTEVTVVNWNPPSAGTGLFVDVTGSNFMYGNGFTGASGKGAVLTLATQNPDSDVITVRAVPSQNSWLIINRIGTWAREA